MRCRKMENGVYGTLPCGTDGEKEGHSRTIVPQSVGCESRAVGHQAVFIGAGTAVRRTQPFLERRV